MATEHQSDWHVCNHLRARNFSLQAASVVTSASNLALTRGSPSNIIFTGDTAGQILTFPDATDCLLDCHEFRIVNESTQKITIRDFDLNVLGEILPGATCRFCLADNTTSAGQWLHEKFMLSKVLFETDCVSGVSGDNFEEFFFNYLSLTGLPVKNEYATGLLNCINLVYTTKYEYINGTLEVWLDGRKLDWGLDYTENGTKDGFTILLNASDPNRLNIAPRNDETLTVAYCRRICF